MPCSKLNKFVLDSDGTLYNIGQAGDQTTATKGRTVWGKWEKGEVRAASASGGAAARLGSAVERGWMWGWEKRSSLKGVGWTGPHPSYLLRIIVRSVMWIRRVTIQ